MDYFFGHGEPVITLADTVSELRTVLTLEHSETDTLKGMQSHCQLTFDGGNVLRIDTQTIPEVNARNGLPIQHTVGFTLRCDDSMQTALTVSDEHRSSSHVALDNSAYTPVRSGK